MNDFTDIVSKAMEVSPDDGDYTGEDGLLYCGECGAKMYNERSDGDAYHKTPKDNYVCASYRKKTTSCTIHFIRTEIIRDLILDTLLQTLYEDYALGRLPEKRHAKLSAQYEAEQAQLEQRSAELTTPMLNEFIDKVIVYERRKINRYPYDQRIEIYFNFIGKVTLPEKETSILKRSLFMQISLLVHCGKENFAVQ